ncbi:MAG: phospho-sugar mutase [Actinomycetota bacterium]
MYDRSAVEAWIADDPDPDTRKELEVLLAASDDPDADAELADRFAGFLQFGTAGLRGTLGAGPNRMNRAVVIRAAAGLAAFLRQEVGEDFSVVIGCDARYGSEQFARDTAAVVTGAGGRALLLPPRLPTPLVAFAVRHLKADAGVMVTASHNPPQDNGYKVYLGGRAVTGAGEGTQIVPPYDAQIAAQIAAVESVAAVPLAGSGWEQLGEGIRESYLDRVVSLVPSGMAGALTIVHTSMHGVGNATTMEAFHRAGFQDVHVVPEQADPDPDFPTIAFPNPEEPGALDLAFDLAKEVHADIILANDPDADRCSVAIPVDGSWRQLTGDEVGWLLGSQAATLAATAGAGGVLACSIVSSRMLEKIAAAHGLRHEYTLTGFKWISRVDGLVFGYEEALGYCVDPQYVRDKDGISASLRIALLASQLLSDGQTLADLLDRLAMQHGAHATNPLTIRVEDLSRIARAMAALRAMPPAELAGSPVVETADLSEGWRGLPPTDALHFLTEAGDRVVARPSGTEPKLKCYLESIVPVVDGDLAAARSAAAERVAAVRADMAALIDRA